MISGPPNPRSVMVGTDRSETAERAVRWAAEFAHRFQADLHVVQVIVPGHPANPAHPANTEGATAERTQAEASADELAKHVQSLAGGRAQGRVIVDADPAMALVRAADELSIDVLVVGNAGMAGRKEFLLGNVPNRISHNARCSVIIVNTLGNNGHPRAGETGIDSDAPQAHPFARGGKIAAVFAKHGIRELFGYPDEDGAVGRRRQAKRLRNAFEELGPTFAKIGQMLSARPDLLPSEFVEELAQLQDRVPPLTQQQVVGAMEQALGVPWEDVFETIQAEPLAAGTIAQVHRASLASGEKVVIKIQRPQAKELIEQDLALLKPFVKMVGNRPEVRQFVDAPAVFEHLASSLRGELDFRLEAANAERLRGALAGFPRLAIPRIHREYSNSHLLVMQDLAGVPAAEIPAGPLRKDVANQLVEAFCKQIFLDGFFHGDPHPGNLMWQPAEERLYFLDFGLIGELGADLREAMILVLTAFWHRDGDFLADVLLMMSGATAWRGLDTAAFRADIEALMARYRGVSTNIQLGPVLQEVIGVSLRHGVPIPAALTLTAKTLSQMQFLDPDIDPFEVAGRYLMRSLVQRLIAKGNPEELFYQSQKMKVRVMKLFESMERMAGSASGQPADSKFPTASLEATVRRAGRRLALGIAGGCSVVASAQVTNSDRVAGWVPIVIGLIGAAFFAALLLDLWRGGFWRGDKETDPARGA